MDTEQDEDLEQDQPDDNGRVALKVEDLRKLRKLAKKSGDHAAEVDGLKREVAILKTGLNLKPAQIKALWSVHEGEMTPDALKATASDLGFVELEEEESETDAEARSAAQQVQRATAGATPPGKSALLTADNVKGWSQQDQRTFRNRHPELWEMWLRDADAKIPNPDPARWK